jgi:hypothetical protein
LYSSAIYKKEKTVIYKCADRLEALLINGPCLKNAAYRFN